MPRKRTGSISGVVAIVRTLARSAWWSARARLRRARERAGGGGGGPPSLSSSVRGGAVRVEHGRRVDDQDAAASGFHSQVKAVGLGRVPRGERVVEAGADRLRWAGGGQGAGKDRSRGFLSVPGA